MNKHWSGPLEMAAWQQKFYILFQSEKEDFSLPSINAIRFCEVNDVQHSSATKSSKRLLRLLNIRKCREASPHSHTLLVSSKMTILASAKDALRNNRVLSEC